MGKNRWPSVEWRISAGQIPDRLYVTPSQLWKSFDPVAFRAFKWHRRPRPWIARRMRMPHREFSDAVRQPPGCKSKL